MAADVERDPGEIEPNHSPNEDSKMSDEPASHQLPHDQACETQLPWTTEQWRLDIRPPSKSNDGNGTITTTARVDEHKAFRLFIKNSFQLLPLDLRFYSNDKSAYFNRSCPTITNDDLPFFFHGAISANEHGIQKYHMHLNVAYHSTTFDEIKTKLLAFLQSTDTWLACHHFSSLDIISAGFFSLRHPYWTDINQFETKLTDFGSRYARTIDPTMLTSEQRDSMEPVLLHPQFHLPPFEIHSQRGIRAYFKKDSKDGPHDTHTISPSAPSKSKPSFISTDALELRFERSHASLFCTLLEGLVDQCLWDFGRFAAYRFRSECPDHYLALVAEQRDFIHNICYIQVNWAHPTVMYGHVDYQLLPQVFSQTATNYTGQPLILALQDLPLPNTDRSNPLAPPLFYAVEPVRTRGIWRLICNKSTVSINRDWFDDTFLRVYQASAGYSSIGNHESHFLTPYRSNGENEFQARVQSMEAKGLTKINHSALTTAASSFRHSKPVNAVVLHKPHLHPDENPWQAVTSRIRRSKDPSAKTSNHTSTSNSISTIKAKSYAAATATTQASTTIPVPPPKWEEKLMSVCNKLQAVESAITSQTTQLTSIRTQQQQHNTRLNELQSQLSHAHKTISTIDAKVTDNVMIVGTFKNSIQHLEVSSQSHADQLSALRTTLEASQVRLAQAEARTQELHNSLQEQLQVQARNLSLFTTALTSP